MVCHGQTQKGRRWRVLQPLEASVPFGMMTRDEKIGVVADAGGQSHDRFIAWLQAMVCDTLPFDGTDLDAQQSRQALA